MGPAKGTHQRQKEDEKEQEQKHMYVHEAFSLFVMRRDCCKVGGQRVAITGTFPTSPLRTVHAPFSAHGSPASPTFEALRLFAFRIPLCLWLGQPAALRLVPGITLGFWLLWRLRYHGTLVL